MRLLRVVLAWLILFAEPCAAATYYVNGGTGNDSNDGSSGSPWASISKANATVQPGDVVNVAAWGTTYAHMPGAGMGARNNPFNVITFIGDSAAPNKVKVTTGDIVCKGLVLNGFRFATGDVSTSDSFDVSGLHIRNSVFAKGFTMRSSNIRFENNFVGGDSSGARFRVFPKYEGDNNVVKNCRMYLRTTDSSETFGYLLYARPEDTSTHLYNVDDLEFTGNKLTLIRLRGQSSDIKLTFHGRLRSSLFSDNRYTFIDSSNSTVGGCQAYLWRDGCVGNLILRDTIEATTAYPGKGNLQFFLRSSGDGQAPTGSNNTWRFCVFKNMTPTTITGEYQGSMWSGDSISHCVFACSTGVGRASPQVQGSEGPFGGTIYRCTFFNRGTSGSFRVDPYGLNLGGTLKVRECIFYTGQTSSTNTGYAAEWKHPTVTGTHEIDSNYNLYYHKPIGHEVAWASGNGGWSYGHVGPSTYCTQFGDECQSRWGDPMFVDTTVANFNPRLTANSAARGIGEFGGDVGAFDYQDMSDVTAPSALALAGDSHDPGVVVLSWLAPGDDGSSGQANRYDVRYSTSLITAGNFSGATQLFSGIPSPSIAGTTESATITGLTVSTNYWFAIKTYDEAGNVSAISNVLMVRTADTHEVED